MSFTLTDSGITYNKQSIQWIDVIQIVVVTTDQGPFVQDVFLEFRGHGQSCVIPTDAEGFEGLFEVFKRFEGFKYETFIEAMSSTDYAEFVCWQKP
jgi:hypothetical protein